MMIGRQCHYKQTIIIIMSCSVIMCKNSKGRMRDVWGCTSSFNRFGPDLLGLSASDLCSGQVKIKSQPSIQVMQGFTNQQKSAALFSNTSEELSIGTTANAVISMISSHSLETCRYGIN